jgi:hypothetical protein
MLMSGFRHGEFPMEPGMAAEQHITDTLERHPILPQVSSLKAFTARKELRKSEKRLRELQGELSEMGEARAVGCLEDALREIGNAYRSLEINGGDER